MSTSAAGDGEVVGKKRAAVASFLVASFLQVDIDAVAYTTYRAFLCWLHTGHIEFAPFLSSCRL